MASSDRIYGTVAIEKLESLYDLIVIGGGPAGVAGAIKAAQMGRRAIIIDRPKAPSLVQSNGLDLFFGAPTGLYSKALRDAAKTINVQALLAQGVDPSVIWKQVQNTVTKLAVRNAESQTKLLKRLKIDYLQGEATLLNPTDPQSRQAQEKYIAETNNDNEEEEEEEEQTLQYRSVLVNDAAVIVTQSNDGDNNNTVVEYPNVVVVTGTKVLCCTGSSATQFDSIPFNDYCILESDSIYKLNFFPQSVVIHGAGIIAIEFANIFKKLGVEKVTMLIRGDLESSSKKLGMDPDICHELIRLLVESGVEFQQGATVAEFQHVPTKQEVDDAQSQHQKITLLLTNDTKLECDLYLAALGRRANGLEECTGLEAAGVNVMKNGVISLNDQSLSFQTSCVNVAAAGDVIGKPALASTSMVQASTAVEYMFHSTTHNDNDNNDSDNDSSKKTQQHDDISIGVWTIPEIGYYGLTKQSAINKGFKVIEGIAKFDQCLRGRVFAPDGLLKLVVCAKTGRVLGVHIIGRDAAEMVHYGMSLVQSQQSTIFTVLSTTFTAVTFHELFKEAALDANFKLDFGMEWQEIFKELKQVFDCSLNLPTLRLAFDALDQDGSGGLDQDELQQLFKDLNRPMDKRTISNIMRLSDVDQNGVIEWNEFQAIWEQCHQEEEEEEENKE